MNSILTQLLGISKWLRAVCSVMGMPLSADLLVLYVDWCRLRSGGMQALMWGSAIL